MSRLTRGVWAAIAVALLALPALPFPQWSHAPDQGPVWAPHVESWAIGLTVVVVAGLLAGRLAYWFGPSRVLWPRPRPGPAVAVLAMALAALSALVMRQVFAGNPHLVDEIAQLFHARVFASGRLSAPTPEPRAAFLITHTWITEAGWVSQYPPGQTVLLAFGLLARAEWLVNPLLGAAGGVLVYLTTRGLYGRSTALAAVVLWTISAWVMFMSATYLNHVGAVTFALAAWACVFGPSRRRTWHLLVAGCALAATAATRPLDAVAAACPILVWLGLGRRWRAFAWIVAGGLPVMAAWGYLNWRIYGGPLTLGYTAVYGAEHGLGFHPDPWGQPFNPFIALSNLAIAIRRLHIYLYEWPIPALLPLAVWAALARQRSWRDLVVAVGALAAPALYFFYWHSGFYIGPRFYYTAVPFLVIGTARAWRWGWALAIRRRPRFLRADVALAAAAALIVLWGWIGILPIRWDAYRAGLATLKLHPERELAARGVRPALVLVPESWGSRIIVRLWGLGVPPGLVERAYRRLDTCDLYRFTTTGEQEAWPASEVAARLDAAAAAVAEAPALLESWPDPTVRFREYTPPEECQVELRRDLRGFTLFGYLAWRNEIGLGSGVVFARDLYEKNPALLARYSGWDLWRYAPRPEAPNGPPVLTHLGTVPGSAP